MERPMNGPAVPGVLYGALLSTASGQRSLQPSFRSLGCRTCTKQWPVSALKKLTALFMLTATLVLPTTSSAADSSIGATLGSAGIGIEFTTRLHQKLRLRALASSLTIPIDGVQDDVDYEADISTFFAGALLDFHPAANAFRVSVGLVLSEPEISLQSVAMQDNYQIGDSSYSGTVNIDGTANFNPMAPWFSLGWASNQNGLGFYWSGDLGFAFVGEPKLSVSATGTAVDNANPAAGEFDVTNSADFLDELERERRTLEEDFSAFQIAPIFNIGIGYRF